MVFSPLSTVSCNRTIKYTKIYLIQNGENGIVCVAVHVQVEQCYVSSVTVHVQVEQCYVSCVTVHIQLEQCYVSCVTVHVQV